MKIKYFIFALILFFSIVLLPTIALAITTDNIPKTTNINTPTTSIELTEVPDMEYSKAVILEISEEIRNQNDGNHTERYQNFKVKILSGTEKGMKVNAKNLNSTSITNKIEHHNIGEKIVISKTYLIDGSINYNYVDTYRLPALIIIFIIFVLLVLIFGRLKGLGSLLGLLFSICVLGFFIVPQIAKGANPLIITIIGSLIIVGVSLYLAHGFNHRTNLSMLSTLLTLTISIGLATIFVHMATLFGMGSEDTFFLQTTQFDDINLQGLLLAGIIIGTLGVLDDITTAQTAIVGELRFANPDLNKHELNKRALVVGKEHISSLVNTLVLAYAGVSLPLFLLFSVYQNTPIWYTINSQFIAEEIVRTFVGSISLILAVPISTYIATHFLSKKDISKMHENKFHEHNH
ncbi:MAG: hypothetical protein COY69_01000 [Candidatus Magasanikbacteria bacterium CG_4_10_14_0_8_um_filter_32_14]|uniref:YibE/F family protein n=2 Tax=Candidatus Magasanikiibacteriota TaxID=1752731 RepID=A0A2M7R9V2_9BACT|nr:MAG: hypothetical protein AUJ23_02355 [Candidatus Magasanikbacteria bacterium CG1_02_32_51]PIY93558.1 MAG: hypothetical protein COY69_01000 [Candidatus Magasanikbacteria bacterium CG_4_10_14_0_8_um_filter_32_14]